MADTGQPNPDIRLMRLSKGTQHVFKGAAYLASQPRGTYHLAEQVAKKLGLPASFLSKLFQRLAHRGLLDSRRGVGGGYCLRAAPGEISLFNLLEAVEEPPTAERKCILATHMCLDGPVCRIHETVLEAELKLREALKNVSLKDLACVRPETSRP